MSYTVLALFAVGIVLLIVGAETLVRGAARLAAAVGISPLVIGLTVVAFGTSSPEVAVSVQSAYAGQADIALGNVVGSNILNVLLILGVSAAIAPLIVARQLIWLDVPVMIAVSFLPLLFGLDGRIGRLEALLLFLSLIGYIVFLIRLSRRENDKAENEFEQEYGGLAGRPARWLLNLALIVIGLALLVLGSRWLVNGAVVIAQAAGVRELIIGLTIVAIGTSLPEIATSITASLRGERDIAVGNIVGSNIFNILAVLGLSGLVAPDGIKVAPAALGFDIPVMIAVAVACLPIFFTGHLIARWEGFLFLGYYAVYTAYLILASIQHDALPLFSMVMLLFVIPITILTLAVVALRALRERRSVEYSGTDHN